MRSLNAALQRGSFDRAYLFFGDDEYLKEERVRALVACVTDSATRDFNLDVRRGSETDAPSLLLALEALPMMAERRVLLLRDVAALRKDARAVLDRYLDHPSADTVLLMTTAAGAKVEERLASRSVGGDRLAHSNRFAWTAHCCDRTTAPMTTPSSGPSTCRK